MTTTSRPAGAHIVGRCPLDGPEDVFRTISGHAGPLLRSMPDGETETNWILRQFDWLHAPVPRDADPQRYLAPYRELSLPQATALYLGLVDMADGIEGARRRVPAHTSMT